MSAPRDPALSDLDLGPGLPACAARAPARPGRIREALGALGRRVRAALEAYARRRIALALGERIDELNQAIRNGAEARRQLETQKEDQP